MLPAQPAPPGVAAQLRQLIHYHLDNGLLDNALFLAGRLHGLDSRNPDALHLLALCNLRMGRYKAAYDHARLKSTAPQHLGCAYVFAQACLALERSQDGVQALEKCRPLWAGTNSWNKHSEISRAHLPDAAACFCLLGKLKNAWGDHKAAIDHFIEALKLNPLMWDAFTGLCDMGVLVRPANIFQITPEMQAALSHHSAAIGHGSNPFAQQDAFETKNPFVLTPEVDPFNTRSRAGGDVGLNLGGSNLLSKLNGSIPAANSNGLGSGYADVGTPTSNGQNIPSDDVMMGGAGGPVMNEPGIVAPHAPGRKTRLQPFGGTEEPPKMRPITSRSRLKMGSESAEATEIPRPIGQNGHKRTVSGHSTQSSNQPLDPTAAPPRRSVRLLNSISSQIRPGNSRLATAGTKDSDARDRREGRKLRATGTKGKTGNLPTVGRVVSGNRKPTVDMSESSSKPDSRPASAAAGMGPPPKMATHYDPGREQEALQWIVDLLLKIGTGYSQLSRFETEAALGTFDTIPIQQRETPWVLAQIGKAFYERAMYADAEKTFLRIREKAPSQVDDMEVFSNTLWHLQKETDLAYLAHTLMDQDRLSPQAWCALGNALSLQREHDQAIKCFCRATQLDPKFAYAFTLQGHEHVVNEELEKATQAYRSAISADNRHYNGWYGLGQVYERMAKYDMAEKHYRAASQINPTNALLAIKIGVVLDRMKKTQPALMQFMNAVALDPQSANARYRKATVLLKLGNPNEALRDLEFCKDVRPDDPNVYFLLGKVYRQLRDKASSIRCFTIAMNLDPKSSSYIKETMESLEDDDVGDFGLLDSDDWVPPIYDEVVAYLAGHWFTGSTLNPFEQSHAILVRYPY